MRGGYGGAGAEGYQIARCWRQLTPSGTPLRRRASSPRGGAQVTAEPQLCDRYKLTESHSPSIRAPSARHHTSSLFLLTLRGRSRALLLHYSLFLLTLRGRSRALLLPYSLFLLTLRGRSRALLLPYSLFLLTLRGRSRAGPLKRQFPVLRTAN